jgi:hypothetical protein
MIWNSCAAANHLSSMEEKTFKSVKVRVSQLFYRGRIKRSKFVPVARLTIYPRYNYSTQPKENTSISPSYLRSLAYLHYFFSSFFAAGFFAGTSSQENAMMTRTPVAMPSAEGDPMVWTIAREMKPPRKRAAMPMTLWSREMTILFKLKSFGSAMSSHHTVVSTTKNGRSLERMNGGAVNGMMHWL